MDTLRLISAIYFLAYCVAPLMFAASDLRVFRWTGWDWILQFDPAGTQWIYAALLGLLSYLCIVMGYGVARVTTATGRLRSWPAPPPAHAVYSRAVILGIVGSCALFWYTVSIGGLGPLIFEAAAFRTHPPVITKWAFLKNIAPLSVAAAYVMAGLSAERPVRGALVRPIGVAFLLIALLTMFHRAARLPLLAFLVTIPLARALRRRRVPVGLVAFAGALFAGIILFGKQVFAGRQSEASLGESWSILGSDLKFALQRIIVEVVFPFVSGGNAVVNVPHLVPYRWFSDFAVAPFYLIPQRLTGIAPPATVSAVNTALLHSDGTIPADVVTLGYFSCGLFGVICVAFLYGVFASMVDRLAERGMPPTGPFGALGVAWMFFAAFASLYTDPQMVLEGGFYLITATVVFYLPRLADLAYDRSAGVSVDRQQSPSQVAAPRHP